MFYTATPSPSLRLGDVVRGFPWVVPHLASPPEGDRLPEYELRITSPSCFVVLTPCCAIGGSKRLSLAPLKELEGSLLRNPYLAKDPLRLNLRMPVEVSMPPEEWTKRGEEYQKERREAAALEGGLTYCHYHYFVYAGSDCFSEYTWRYKASSITTRSQLLDFREAFSVECDAVLNQSVLAVEMKRLELEAEARRQLRDKLAWYFGRPALEDLAILAVY